MTQLRCPTCEKPFDPTNSVAMPFCSPRCRQIDLGRWLDEMHRLPWEPEDEADSPDHKSARKSLLDED